MSKQQRRVVLVTGAAGNVGRALAAALARDGARTILADRSLEHLRGAYPGESATDDRLLVGDVDLTEEASLAAALAPARQRFGAIDALVSTVGGYRAGTPAHQESWDTWEYLMRLNVRTLLVAVRAVLPEMLERGRGAIVGIASRDALAAPANAGAYAASKAALLRVLESLAQETKERGVTVNAVLPGTLDTPQNRAALPENRWPALVPPASVAETIAFLVSPAACGITGTAIPVLGRS